MFEFIYLHLGTPLKEINRNVAPKRRRIVVPLLNEEPSSCPAVTWSKVLLCLANPRSHQTSILKNVHPTNLVQNQSQRQLKIDVYIVVMQGPCVASGSFRCFGARRADKDYRSYWKSLIDCGFWQCPQYLECKTAAGIPEEELREIMPCVLNDVRNRYPKSKPSWCSLHVWHKRF